MKEEIIFPASLVVGILVLFAQPNLPQEGVFVISIAIPIIASAVTIFVHIQNVTAKNKSH